MVYSDYLGTWVSRFVTSTHPSDVYDGTTLYEWDEENCAYMNDAEDILFYDTISRDSDVGYFHFGREVGDE